MDDKERILNLIFKFFVESKDYNGIPLRSIGDELEIDYKVSIDLIIELVMDDLVSIQSSTNPHIIGFQHFQLEDQCHILQKAKSTTVTEHTMGDFTFYAENTEFPICLYPSPAYLCKHRDLAEFGTAVYSKKLALGVPQLRLFYFDIEVLDRYAGDPRYAFRFEDYAGDIYCKYDENDRPLVRDEDEIFLKSFGLGYDEMGQRLAVVPLTYLKRLTPEHQVYWSGKEYTGQGQVLREYYDNIILGEWTFRHSIFSGFIGEQNCLNELAEKIFGKKLFKVSYTKEDRPREFTLFFKPTRKNYLDFVLLLDKMVSDNINKDFFRGEVDLEELVPIEGGMVERRQKGTLRIFEDWMRKKCNGADDAIQEIFKVFKKVRKERQEPAHKITANDYDKNYDKKQKELICEAYESMMNLRMAFASHEDAKGFEVPGWLDPAKITPF